MINYAHRGNHHDYAENTLPAFKSAMDKKADGIELDVRMTKDNFVVVFHDRTLNRLTIDKGKVIDKTFAELQSLPFKQAGQIGIPRLVDYLDWVASTDLYSNIEIKRDEDQPPHLESEVMAILQDYAMEDRVILSSFDPQSLQSCRELAPNYKVAYLFNNESLHHIGLSDSGANLKALFEMLSQLDVDYVHPEFPLLTDKLFTFADIYKLKINTWTVNCKNDMQSLLDQNVEGVITDFPEDLYQVIQASHLRSI